MPDGSSTPLAPDADTATSTTPASEEEEAADARGDMGDTQAPDGTSARERGVDVDGGAEVVSDSVVLVNSSPASDEVSPSPTDVVNDNDLPTCQQPAPNSRLNPAFVGALPVDAGARRCH